ncbi:MAG: DUF4249 domain-containing protein [Bacteroidales bacterium]|nr:DUF4249 domain-containing protein [Bacteroidales bacterium]
MIAGLFLLNSCIDSYTPAIRSADTSKYVVTGQVDNKDTLQTVNVSLSSSISDPSYISVTGCTIRIQDDNGHHFPLTDNGDGSYSGKIDPQYMYPGSAFRVSIKTPDGTEIESDYDTIFGGPPIDSVYYKLKSEYQIDAVTAVQGIQLYTDLKKQESDSRYYRWVLTETWEYHSKWPINWYYSNGAVHHAVPTDSSKMVCYHTLPITNVYLYSTRNLAQSSSYECKLNFIGGNTPRLLYGYSLLIKQEALSQEAYNYWSQLKLNVTTNGGLYEKQPLVVIGNLHNLTNPNKQVLGFFSAVTSHTKRIFIPPVPGLKLTYIEGCNIIWMKKGLLGLNLLGYPVYFLGDVDWYTPYYIYQRDCVDCTLQGGVTQKPSFWPN